MCVTNIVFSAALMLGAFRIDEDFSYRPWFYAWLVSRFYSIYRSIDRSVGFDRHIQTDARYTEHFFEGRERVYVVSHFR